MIANSDLTKREKHFYRRICSYKYSYDSYDSE